MLNRLINKVRSGMGLSRLSFAKKVKTRVKEAVKFISDFEETAIQIAIEEGYDYVICGHIHKPQARTVEKEGKSVTYLNSGDWVENLTALEYAWGRWSLYEYHESDYHFVNPKLAVGAFHEPESEPDTPGIPHLAVTLNQIQKGVV